MVCDASSDTRCVLCFCKRVPELVATGKRQGRRLWLGCDGALASPRCLVPGPVLRRDPLGHDVGLVEGRVPAPLGVRGVREGRHLRREGVPLPAQEPKPGAAGLARGREGVVAR